MPPKILSPEALGHALKDVRKGLVLARIETPPFCDMRWRPILSHGHSYAFCCDTTSPPWSGTCR